MIELIKEIILDAQSGQLFTGTQRGLNLQPVENKATIIIGVRRCGKSTLLNQVASHLSSAGVARENMLFVNFFDDRLTNLKILGLDLVIQAYYSLYPIKKSKEKVYYFFDEIQVMPGWESFIDRLLRSENCEIYLSGSSAQMLSKEIATQMRGRSLSWELFPFSFQEITDHLAVEKELPLNSRRRLLVENAMDQYFDCGGFPEVVGLEKSVRIKIHQEYFNSILFRDLIERYDISHPRALIDLAKKLLDNIASMYTLNSLTLFLKSLGHNTPKSSVADYLTWFEDAYFLFTVRMFDASYRRSNANPKKIYCIDHALVASVSSGILVNSGHLWENMVFVALRRFTSDIFYYKTKGNLEVDFIFKTRSGKNELVQVCETLANPATRQREINALQVAMSELNLTEGSIVTKSEEESVTTEAGIILIVPVWKFLLGISQ
jgi:hypothetical protein